MSSETAVRPSISELENNALGNVKDQKSEFGNISKVFNGVPHLEEDTIFVNKFKIHSRFGWDDRFGATYFALPLNDSKELVLRIDSGSRKEPTNLFAETALLKKAESSHNYLLFSQIHSYDLTAKYPWLAVYNRDGPTVHQCIQFLEEKKFSHGTAGRFAFDILSILQFLHNNAFLATNLNMDIFRYDPCSRNVFLADLSYVRIDPSKRQLRIKPNITWMGTPHFAPLAFHGNADLTQWDELEAFFYIFYEMVVGKLPWDGKRLDEIVTTKLLFSQEDNFKDLPEQYLNLLGSKLRLRD
uniref:Protein kinase domain-containing protein n=1 Tax=Panagrolaimus sp. JU765 TaxID=591449 RepID=A0AC34PW88_9BILA